MTDAAKASLDEAIEGYAAALAADSLNPRPDYNVDGQSVTRSTWREHIMSLIRDAQRLINSDTAVWKKSRSNRCW